MSGYKGEWATVSYVHDALGVSAVHVLPELPLHCWRDIRLWLAAAVEVVNAVPQAVEAL